MLKKHDLNKEIRCVPTYVVKIKFHFKTSSSGMHLFPHHRGGVLNTSRSQDYLQEIDYAWEVAARFSLQINRLWKVAIHSTIFYLERTQTPRETSYRRQVTPTNQLSLPIFLKPAPFPLFHKYTRKMSATQARLLLTKFLCLKEFLRKSCFPIKLFEIVSSNWNFWPPALLNPATGPHTFRKQNPPTPPPIHAYSPLPRHKQATLLFPNYP